MRLGILTDLHLRQPGSGAGGWHNPHQFDTARQRLTTALDVLDTQRVDQIAVLGDLTHDGDDTTFADVLNILATSPVPVWIVPGNHDLAPDACGLATAITNQAGQLELLSGTVQPLVNSWQVAGLGIAQGNGGYDIDPMPDIAIWGGAPTLVLSHFPLLSLQDEALAAELKYAGDPLNGMSVSSHLHTRTAPTLVLSGHLHIRHTQAVGPVLQASCGAQIESLFEVTVLDLTEWPAGVVRWEATAIEPVWPGIIPALSDPEQAWLWNGTTWQPLRP